MENFVLFLSIFIIIFVVYLNYVKKQKIFKTTTLSYK